MHQWGNSGWESRNRSELEVVVHSLFLVARLQRRQNCPKFKTSPVCLADSRLAVAAEWDPCPKKNSEVVVLFLLLFDFPSILLLALNLSVKRMEPEQKILFLWVSVACPPHTTRWPFSGLISFQLVACPVSPVLILCLHLGSQSTARLALNW